MKPLISLCAITACSLLIGNSASAALLLTTAMNGGSAPANNAALDDGVAPADVFIIEDYDYDTGDATNPLLDIRIEATVTDLGGSTTQSFKSFNAKEQDGLSGLGIESTSGNQWLSTDVGGNTLSERLTLTFFLADTSTQMTIDLGSGGAIAAVNNNGGVGAKLIADGTVQDNLSHNTSYFANTTGITTFEAFADGVNGSKNTRFSLASLDIVNATVIPEPSAFSLIIAVLAGLTMTRRRRTN